MIFQSGALSDTLVVSVTELLYVPVPMSPKMPTLKSWVNDVVSLCSVKVMRDAFED